MHTPNTEITQHFCVLKQHFFSSEPFTSFVAKNYAALKKTFLFCVFRISNENVRIIRNEYKKFLR